MKTYICDACGKVIKNPYEAKMKQFYYSADYEFGGAFPKPQTVKETVDLCEDCFKNLGRLFGNETLAESK